MTHDNVGRDDFQLSQESLAMLLRLSAARAELTMWFEGGSINGIHCDEFRICGWSGSSKQFTCDGDDAPPPITVTEPPERPEVRRHCGRSHAPKGTFTHWLGYPFPLMATPCAHGGKTLKNDFGRKGYGGPCPPAGHGTHRYYFTVYAVDAPALDVRGDSRDDLEAALKDHALAKAQLMGRYERMR